MQDTDRAMSSFDNALRHNPNSIIALTSAANIARNKDQFDKAIEYFQRVLNIKQDNGEVWGSMGESTWVTRIRGSGSADSYRSLLANEG